MSNTQEQFLDEVKKDSLVNDDAIFNDLVDKKGEPKTEEVKSEDNSDDEEKPKTRRYRRLETKMKEIEDMNIALNERIKALSELEKYSKEHEGEVDPDMVKIFGTDENGKALQGYFKKFKEDIKTEAEEAAIARINAESEKASAEEEANSTTIDEAFDNIEDKYNVDLSGKTKSSQALRVGFLDFIEEISPKDSNGDIVEYADFDKSFDIYSKINSREKPREVSARQKELASRTMIDSGSPAMEGPKGPVDFKSVTRYLDSLRG